MSLGMKYSFIDIGQSFLGKPPLNILRPKEFWAIRNVSFTVAKGEAVGIIGANGSGKSTLLKMLNGTFMPDHGEIILRGKTGALLEIGLGFHPLLTGRENIYLNATILGMSTREIDKKFSDIVEFSGISDFLDTPVKNYSSGMYVRLGFSIAIHLEPEILLIDEILSVGDESFRKRSLKKMKEIRQNGATIIFVSHGLEQVNSFCQRAIWLEKGRIKKIGQAELVTKAYLNNQTQNDES